MRDPDRAFGLVDVLAARPARAERVHFQVHGLKLNRNVILLREDIHRCEGRVPPVVRVERGNPNQPVNAELALEVSVREPSPDLEHRALDARLIRGDEIHELRVILVALKPAGVHAEKNLRPVTGIRASSPGVDGHEDAFPVVLSGKEGLKLLLLRAPGKPVQLPTDFVDVRAVRTLVGHIEKLDLVGQLLLERAVGLEDGLGRLQLGKQLLRAIAVVPEVGRRHLPINLADARLFRREVKDSPGARADGPATPSIWK